MIKKLKAGSTIYIITTTFYNTFEKAKISTHYIRKVYKAASVKNVCNSRDVFHWTVADPTKKIIGYFMQIFIMVVIINTYKNKTLVNFFCSCW